MSLRPIRPAALAAALLCALLLLAGASSTAGAQSEQTLRDRVAGSKQRESSLSSAAARLGGLERQARREIAILQGRIDRVQADLDAAQARLARTRGRLDDAQERVARLERRLAQVRGKLSTVLRSRYVVGQPDVVTFVLGAASFGDLLERTEFLGRVRDADTDLLGTVREARVEADREEAHLDRLEAEQAETAAAVGRERAALAVIGASLARREATLRQARAARLQALASTRAGRLAAQRSLSRLLAARERARAQAAREATQFAARAAAGPSASPTPVPAGGSSTGPWAIPTEIVMCESGGQNLTPNSAGASGYYQFLPDTWKGLGGSTPQAYQASRGEQDRLAAKLWAGGAGAHNWVCAALVGAI